MIRFPTLSRPLARATCVAIACLLLRITFAQVQRQTPPRAAAEQAAETTLRWSARGAVKRYRLQVARDPKFNDIIFDGAVVGLERRVTLPPGRYYWRVAPAPKETGRFTAPELVEVGRSEPTPLLPPQPAVSPRPLPAATPAAPPLMRPPANLGWQTATGPVSGPIAARLRPGQPPDVIAVNAEGTVFALDGSNGAALWTARFNPGRRPAAAGPPDAPGPNVFMPVVLKRQGEKPAVLVAFTEGVRLLDGETGAELWRAKLMGRPVSGCAAELNSDESVQEAVVVTDDPATMYVLDSATGAVTGQTKLDGAAVGPPIPFQEGNERGIAITLAGARLEVRRADGNRLRPSVKYDVPFVTPPLVITGSRGTIIIIGTEHGLLFLKGDMKPLGRISTEDDAPRGRIAAADIDGDGLLEIVMVTRRGRLALITGDGKIRWSTQGARGAYRAAFADLNRDGVLDVLIADEGVFARGFSGRDGRLIWQADEEPKTAAGAGGEGVFLRSIAVRPAEGAPLVVSNDPVRGVLRAVGLPAGSVTPNGK